MDIMQIRKYLYRRSGGLCEWCGNFVAFDKFEMAHRIKQDKTPGGTGSIKYIHEFLKNVYHKEISKKQARALLHDPDNLRVACRRYCNDRFNIFNKPVKRDRLLIHLLQKHGIIKFNKK
jgi:hypothetical protein